MTVNVKGTLEVWQEVAEIGPMLWRLAGLRSPLFESERYLLAEILRDVADALERGIPAASCRSFRKARVAGRSIGPGKEVKVQGLSVRATLKPTPSYRWPLATTRRSAERRPTGSLIQDPPRRIRRFGSPPSIQVLPSVGGVPP